MHAKKLYSRREAALKFAVRPGGFARVGQNETTGFDQAMRLNRKDFQIHWDRAIHQGDGLSDDGDILMGGSKRQQGQARGESRRPQRELIAARRMG